MSAEYSKENTTLHQAAADTVSAVIKSQKFPFGATVTVCSPDDAWEAVITIKVQETKKQLQ